MTAVDLLFFALTLAAVLGFGLMVGVFFAFSTFVMRALARRPSAEAIAAMQSINVAVLNPWFLGVVFGTAAAGSFALIGAIMHWDKPGVVSLFAGSALYLLGTFLVTIAFNVPLNNSLAAVAPGDLDGPQKWGDYLKSVAMRIPAQSELQ